MFSVAKAVKSNRKLSVSTAPMNITLKQHKKDQFILQSIWIAFYNPKVLGTVMQYSLLSLIIGCPQNTVENTLQFVLSPLYKKLNLGKNSGYKRPTLFLGWGEGLGMCD